MRSDEPPDELNRLVRHYAKRTQQPVQYIVSSWHKSLHTWPNETRALTDNRWTHPTSNGNRRTIDRQDLVNLLKVTDLNDRVSVRAAFILVVAWGSGVSVTRSYRHLPRALSHPQCAERLSSAARSCQSDDLAGAYAGFALPGVGRSFFTKWFAFAGTTSGRAWQPLILDDRVLATLYKTMHISTRDLAGSARWSQRYDAYVQQLHRWSSQLADRGLPCSAERLEWILFRHGGAPCPPSPS